MTRLDVAVDGATWTVSPLEPPRVGDRECALLRLQLVDEMTDEAPHATVTATVVEPSAAGVTARVVDTGLIGVRGRPRPAFSPDLAATSSVVIELAATRFAARRVEVDFACSRRTLTSVASASVLSLTSSAGLAVRQRLLLGTPDRTQPMIVTIQALGPAPNQVTVVEPLLSSYPVGSEVLPLPADQKIELRRAPTSITGRVLMRSGAALAGVPFAVVRVSKLWRTLPQAGAVALPEPPVVGVPAPAPPWDAPIVAVWPPVYADAAQGAALTIEDRPVDGTMSPKTLLSDVSPGSVELRLSDGVGIAPNDVLAIDADDAGRREIVEVKAVVASLAATDWTRVIVAQPTALEHRRGRIVRRLGAPAGGTPRSLNYAAASGDEALLFDASGLTGTHQVCLVHAAAAFTHSFYRISVLATQCDAQGFYRLPAFTRAGKVELFAKDPASPAHTTTEIVPDYDLPDNQVDLTIS